MLLHVSSTCAHRQEVKIALHSLWYHHTYRWPSRSQVERGPTSPLSTCVNETTTYRRDGTRGCVIQFWPPDDEHMCSKHVEAWNKLIVKQKFCASSWLITETKILRCTVSKKVKIRRLNIYNMNKNPTDATVCRYLFTAKLLYMFRVSQHPSSGVLKTVSAASGTGHTT